MGFSHALLGLLCLILLLLISLVLQPFEHFLKWLFPAYSKSPSERFGSEKMRVETSRLHSLTSLDKTDQHVSNLLVALLTSQLLVKLPRNTAFTSIWLIQSQQY